MKADPREERGGGELLAHAHRRRVAHERGEEAAHRVEPDDRGVGGGRPQRQQHATERGPADARHLAGGGDAGDGAGQRRQRHEPRHQGRAAGILERPRGAQDDDEGQDALRVSHPATVPIASAATAAPSTT